MAKTQNERIIFGLKVKQLRQERGLSFVDLAKLTGVSVSYLNEIEKGKKYPKPEKTDVLAQVLGVTVEDLTSPELDNALAPVTQLLQSNFLNELPLDLFGIELSKVVEIIANAPARVGAFISTLLDISRNYALREENFYFGALRAYLELHNNYFPEIEAAVEQLGARYGINRQRPIPAQMLQTLLEEEFRCTVVADGLDNYPEFQDLRAVFLPNKQQLLLNSNLTDMQRGFQLGKELGFRALQLKERANTSSLLRGKVFEEVLNHSKATYFSVALHIPLDSITADLEQFFARDAWSAEVFLAIMQRYEATPEMFYHRLTNVLPQRFGMEQLFFLRFLHDPQGNQVEIDKELHLSRRHPPHSNGLQEHYCRRWVGLSALQDLQAMQRAGTYTKAVVRAQRSKYMDTDDEYFCITIARAGYPSPKYNVSVTLGLLLSPELAPKINFLNDPTISRRAVNKTCERCQEIHCAERAAPPSIILKKQKMRQIYQRLAALDTV